MNVVVVRFDPILANKLVSFATFCILLSELSLCQTSVSIPKEQMVKIKTMVLVIRLIIGTRDFWKAASLSSIEPRYSLTAFFRAASSWSFI